MSDLDEILENWLDEAFNTSTLAIGIDGYRGITDEDKIEKARQEDYDKALEKAKKKLQQWALEQRIDELENCTGAEMQLRNSSHIQKRLAELRKQIKGEE